MAGGEEGTHGQFLPGGIESALRCQAEIGMEAGKPCPSGGRELVEVEGKELALDEAGEEKAFAAGLIIRRSRAKLDAVPARGSWRRAASMAHPFRVIIAWVAPFSGNAISCACDAKVDASLWNPPQGAKRLYDCVMLSLLDGVHRNDRKTYCVYLNICA
jgi:hypothetical protein